MIQHRFETNKYNKGIAHESNPSCSPFIPEDSSKHKLLNQPENEMNKMKGKILNLNRNSIPTIENPPLKTSELISTKSRIKRSIDKYK